MHGGSGRGCMQEIKLQQTYATHFSEGSTLNINMHTVHNLLMFNGDIIQRKQQVLVIVNSRGDR